MHETELVSPDACGYIAGPLSLRAKDPSVDEDWAAVTYETECLAYLNLSCISYI